MACDRSDLTLPVGGIPFRCSIGITLRCSIGITFRRTKSELVRTCIHGESSDPARRRDQEIPDRRSGDARACGDSPGYPLRRVGLDIRSLRMWKVHFALDSGTPRFPQRWRLLAQREASGRIEDERAVADPEPRDRFHLSSL